MRTWWRSLRAYSFPATIIPIVCAALIVRWRQPEALAWAGFALMLLAGLLLHAGVNVLNDYHDFQRGLDTVATQGGSGVLTKGLIKPATLRRWGIGYLAAGSLAGLSLAWLISWWLLLPSFLGLLGSYFYSHAHGYKYIGLGEPLVFLLMGPLLFCSAIVAAGGVFNGQALLLSLPFAFLVTAIMLVNNIRDSADDHAAGVPTLPVRLGDRAAKAIYALLLLAAPIATVIYSLCGLLPPKTLLASLTLLPAILLARRVALAASPYTSLSHSPQQTALLYLLYGGALALLISY